MIYVTNGYTMYEFSTEKQAFDFINTDAQKHNLSVEQVYNHTENDMQVLIYQYHTLYLETYIIHHKIDLRKQGE